MPFAAGEEVLIDRLRNHGALALSLVAEQNGKICGHLALSPATHDSESDGWFALGPISVEPELQRAGIGSALIEEAKAWLQSCDAKGCILTGDTNYYSRHGFIRAAAHAPGNEPAQHFMVLPLQRNIPLGRFGFHSAFYA